MVNFTNFPPGFPINNFKFLQEFIKGYQKSIKSFEPIMKQLQQETKRMIPYFQEIQKRIGPLLEPLQKHAEVVQSLIKHAKVRKEVFLEAGWWIPPSMSHVSYPLIATAIYKYQKGQKNAIAELFINFYHEESFSPLKLMVENWEKNIYFNQWANIIENALEAHIQKKYNLSVPVLLLMVEGIAMNYCETKGVSSKNMRSKGNEKIKTALEKAKANNSDLKFLWIDFLFEAIEKRIFEHTDRIAHKAGDYRNFLNRHAVMHGLTNTYGTVENSLQCFMLLDVLSLLK